MSGKEHWDKVERLEALGKSRNREDIKLLLDVLDDRKECWHTKSAAMRALVARNEPRAGAAILKVLARDRDVDTREAAIDALAALGFEKARRLLERIAEDDTPHLAAAARRALLKIDPAS